MVSILNNQELLSMADAAKVLRCTRKAAYDYADATARKAKGKRWLETCLVGDRRRTTLECCQRFLQQEEPVELETPVSTNYEAAKRLMESL